MWIELFHVHLLRCYTNLLGVVEFTLHLFSPGLLERLLAAILPLRAMEILLPLVTWRIQEIQEIDEFHTFFLTESFRVHIFAFQIRHQRSGWPNLAMVFQVTEADLALSLLPLSLRRLPPRRRLFFLDPYSICENIGKQMTAEKPGCFSLKGKPWTIWYWSCRHSAPPCRAMWLRLAPRRLVKKVSWDACHEVRVPRGNLWTPTKNSMSHDFSWCFMSVFCSFWPGRPLWCTAFGKTTSASVWDKPT